MLTRCSCATCACFACLTSTSSCCVCLLKNICSLLKMQGCKLVSYICIIKHSCVQILSGQIIFSPRGGCRTLYWIPIGKLKSTIPPPPPVTKPERNTHPIAELCHTVVQRAEFSTYICQQVIKQRLARTNFLAKFLVNCR